MEAANKSILLVEDDADIRQALTEVFEDENYTVEGFENAEEALSAIHKHGTRKYDVIVSDIKLSKGDGLSFTQAVRKMDLEIPVILMTAFGDIDTAVQGIRLGVFDYIRKPFGPDVILTCVKRAIGSRTPAPALERAAVRVPGPGAKSQLIGKSPEIENLKEIVSRVAPTGANVLIVGESGSGKEVVARLIHEQSERHAKPFVAVNCSAIPADLLESELFGHVKGAFTGALQSRRGLFQEADGGTIFLDEIGDMPPLLQVKLLRAIQEKKIRAVGDNNVKNVDIRIIAATHRDLSQAIKNESFREDLYYRLSVVSISVPSLRSRKGDIMELAEFFLKKLAPLYGTQEKKISREAALKLTEYPWPGNVRQLENLIERALIFSRGPVIEVGDIECDEQESSGEFDFGGTAEAQPLKEIEKQYITHVLKLVDGKREKAAKLLQIDRKTLYRKAIEYGLKEGPAGAPPENH